MSEEVRAQLAARAAVQRLCIRTKMIYTSAPPTAAAPTNKTMFTYKGAGVFYPQAVMVSGLGGGVYLPPYLDKNGYSVAIHDMRDALICTSGQVMLNTCLNNYFDNFDTGVSLTNDEWYVIHWVKPQDFAGITATALYVVFIGQEYLFAN